MPGSRQTGPDVGFPSRVGPSRPGGAGLTAGDPGGTGAAPPWPVPDADRFIFEEVGTVVGLVPPGTPPLHLRVTFDRWGVEMAGSPAAPGRVPWSAVRGVWPGPTLAAPSGGPVTPVDLVWVGGSARLLLPGDRSRTVAVSALEMFLLRWSPPPPGAPPVPPASPGRTLPGQAQALPPWGVPLPWTVPPSALPPPGFAPSVPPPARKRRRAPLVVGLVLILAAAGLAVGLSGHHASSGGGVGGGVHHATPVPLSPDQQLADRIMLTRSDLPVGWTVDHPSGSSSGSPRLRSGEATITRAFAACMGLSADQATVVLGGRGADQTAQAASPIFAAPTSSSQPGAAVELQTAAAVVRTHGDEQRDLAPLSDPRYPGCTATATAAELQLGVDAASGSEGRPGPATPAVVSFPVASGERLTALSVVFTVTDGTASVPVQVTSVMIGSDRIEADLQAFAIGGAVPADVLHASVAAFVQRVASGGRSVQI